MAMERKTIEHNLKTTRNKEQINLKRIISNRVE